MPVTRLARQILISGGAALGRAIAILLNLLSPALVVIGGRAAASQLYTEQARTDGQRRVARAAVPQRAHHHQRYRAHLGRARSGDA